MVRAVSHHSCNDLHPHQDCKGIPFLLLFVAFIPAGLLDEGHSDQNEGMLRLDTISLSLIIGRVEHLFTCPTATCLPSWKKYPCKSLPQILFSWVVCVFDSTSCLQILEMNNLTIPWFADCFFFLSEGCLFLSLRGSLAVQMLLKVN